MRDDEPGPWALVRRGDPFAPFTDPSCPGSSQVRAAQVRLGERTVELPPLDDLYSDRWDELPTVPDATAWLRYELTGTPVGPIACDIRYQDGKRPVSVVVDDWSAPVDGEPAYGAPEMHIAMTFRNYLKMRTGELTALEAIEDGGTVDARWTLLLMLHGLLQEPEYIGHLPRPPGDPRRARVVGRGRSLDPGPRLVLIASGLGAASSTLHASVGAVVRLVNLTERSSSPGAG